MSLQLAAGERVGSFEIKDLLGKGGMGEVYRARDLRLRRDVALKLLPERFAANPRRVARLEREARILASLNHPCIATLYDFQKSEERAFLVMELIQGESLRQRLRKSALSWVEARPLLLQILEGLSAAHAAGIVHRDLKPSNIFITPEQRVKIIDFGIATRGLTSTDRDHSEKSTFTDAKKQMVGFVGTAGYMSPEQVAGRRVDPRTDVWSFGCVAFEVLAGQPCFPGRSVPERLAGILYKSVELSRLPAAVPDYLKTLLSGCLEKNLAARVSDVDEVLQILRAEGTVATGGGERSAPVALPAGTVTFLSTEIEDATRLMRQLGDDFARLRTMHLEVLRGVTGALGGSECAAGVDSALFAFATVSPAIEAAISVQRELRRLPPAGAALAWRMGVHTGQPAITAGGYIGVDLYRVARIAGAAHGGQIILSRTSTELVRQQLPENVRLVPLGHHLLPGTEGPEMLFQLAAPELDLQFPPLRTRGLPSSALLRASDQLVGRSIELLELSSLLTSGQARIVTVTGAGGTGKTRLAVAIADAVGDHFADGVVRVDLAAVGEPDLVPYAIAMAAGIRLDGEKTPEETLIRELAAKRTMLLLDNFEHLREATTLVEQIHAHCPAVAQLITSRVSLRARGEREYLLKPLATPPQGMEDPDRLREFAAVQVLLRMMRAVDGSLVIDDDVLRDTAEITRRLDGLPLALELAAARIKALHPRALLRRLESRLDSLGIRERSDLGRHRGLRDSIRWSFEALAPELRGVLARLSIFNGGFSLEVVAEVLQIDPNAALDHLSTLLDHSLISRAEDTDSERFAMLQTIREFAAEKLAEDGEAAGWRRLHLEWMCRRARRAEARLWGPGQLAELDELEMEVGNVRAALESAVKIPDLGVLGLELASSLLVLWWHRHLSEGRRWLERLLSLDVNRDTSFRAVGLTSAAFLSYYAGSADDSCRQIEESIALSRATGRHRRTLGTALGLHARILASRGDCGVAVEEATEGVETFRALGGGGALAIALGVLGDVAFAASDVTLAERSWLESIAILEALGEAWLVAASIARLGDLALRRGDLDLAQRQLERSVELWRAAGSGAGTAQALAGLGQVSAAQGTWQHAHACFRESLLLARQLGSVGEYCWALAGIAAFEQWKGRPERACRLFGAAESQGRRSGHAIRALFENEQAASLAALEPLLGASAFAQLWAEGALLSADEALHYALGGPSNDL